jgi:translation initiation factor 1 (eIF-1/SUI1)
MKILSIKDIVRKDVPIYYRRLYSGIAVLELINKSIETHIDFSIEHKPTGHKETLVTLIDKVDYPLVPLVAELKKHLSDLDSKGSLPD